jgi:hypothetical protein
VPNNTQAPLFSINIKPSNAFNAEFDNTTPAEKSVTHQVRNNSYVSSKGVTNALNFVHSMHSGNHWQDRVLTVQIPPANHTRTIVHEVLVRREKSFQGTFGNIHNAIQDFCQKDSAELVIPMCVASYPSGTPDHFVTGIVKKTEGKYELIVDNSFINSGYCDDAFRQLKNILTLYNVPKLQLDAATLTSNEVNTNGTNECPYRTFENILSLSYPVDAPLPLDQRMAAKWNTRLFRINQKNLTNISKRYFINADFAMHSSPTSLKTIKQKGLTPRFNTAMSQDRINTLKNDSVTLANIFNAKAVNGVYPAQNYLNNNHPPPRPLGALNLRTQLFNSPPPQPNNAAAATPNNNTSGQAAEAPVDTNVATVPNTALSSAKPLPAEETAKSVVAAKTSTPSTVEKATETTSSDINTDESSIAPTVAKIFGGMLIAAGLIVMIFFLAASTGIIMSLAAIGAAAVVAGVISVIAGFALDGKKENSSANDTAKNNTLTKKRQLSSLNKSQDNKDKVHTKEEALPTINNSFNADRSNKSFISY